MSIRTKISLAYSLLFSILIAISGGLYLHYFIKTSRESIIRDINNYAEIVTPSMVHSYEFYKETSPLLLYREIYPILENNPYLKYVEIISPNGTVLFNSEKARMGLVEPQRVSENFYPYIKKLYPTNFIDENYNVHVFIPFLDEFGNHLYTVHYVNSLTGTLQRIRKSLVIITSVIVIAIVLSIIVSNIVARSITRKIDKLKQSAIELEHGNLDVNFDIQSKDEIGELATVFEDMRKTIKTNITQLQKTLRELKELDRVKNEFITNISHELKTPLTAAIGYISLIKRGKIGNVSDEVVGALKIVEKNLNELYLKIDSILQITKLQMYREHMEKKDVDLLKIVKKCCDNYRPTAEMKNIELEVKLPDEKVYIEGDEKSLESMVCNLVDNAVKFTNTGKVMVRLRLGQNGKYTVLEVEDTGIGIPREKIKKIFDRFYQVDSSNIRKYGGIGLGLSIVKEVVELHNGIVRVKSEEGKGTLFKVLLPLKGEGNDEENPGS